MQELEKILEEIEHLEKIQFSSYTKPLITIEDVEKIIRKHMNDGWIPVEDERLWDILFEEACVEGEQAKRIYNRLKETFGGERSEMGGRS